MCGTQRCKATPSAIIGVQDAAEVVVSTSHTCLRTTGGAVSCWGVNANGTLGNGGFGAAVYTPAAVSGLSSGVTKLATAGYSHTTCAVKAGEVYCWGRTFGEGNLGHDPAADAACTSSTCAPSPVKISGLTGVFDLAVGERASCVVVQGGAVKCWGSNLFGQLGVGAAEPSGYTVRAVSGVSQVVALSGSMATLCARTQTGTLWCWGLAESGGVGDGSITGAACSQGACRATPAQVTLPTGSVQHAIGSTSFSLDASGALSGWGANGFGELAHAPGSAGDATCGAGNCAASPQLIAL